MNAGLSALATYTSPRSRGEIWHLYRAYLPRRSITGRLLFGLVWRRRDRNRWIYRKVERRRGQG
jgi:hypothetical protein